MDDITRAYYEGKFNVAFLTAKADEFQTLFESVMAKAYPEDFIPCRPWGNTGDRKNDGYLRSERTLFQVYAPNEMSATEAIAKIDKDFRGALPYWGQFFENWVFVHNAYDGLSPQIIAKLLELGHQHSPLKLSHWTLEELRRRLWRIPLDGLQSLFGFGPTGPTTPSSTLPFVEVRDADIYGKDADPNGFSPSLREFEERLVHRPTLCDQVEAALLEKRFVCLLGKGASGKTTLAFVLAFSKPFGPERSYYVDLADADDVTGAAEPYCAAMHAIARRHGRDALVIVDNIHLAEGLAHKLHLAWREESQPVRLLLQGRLTQRGADRRGRHSLLEDFQRAAIVLEVMPNDLTGVLQRLVRRTILNHPVLAIPPAVLDQWLKVFGGELIAFSFAVRRKLPQILRGHLQLTEMDAADYIRDEYLENADYPLTPEEHKNLLAIAACADWELPVPERALPYRTESARALSLGHGLVWRSNCGPFGQQVRYRLCHPGLGKLLWAAAKPEKPKFDSACETSQNYPPFGFNVASCLLRLNDDDVGAKRILVAVTSKPDAFERLIEIEILSPTQCRLLTELEVVSETGLDQKLAACKNILASALATRLHVFRRFLEYAQTTLPTVWQLLADVLAKEEHRQSLVRSALVTPMAELVYFLRYAQVEGNLPAVFEAIRDALELPENLANRTQFVEAALALPPKKLELFLQKLEYFLKYAQAETNLPLVFKAMRDALELPDNSVNRARLVQAALATSLDLLENFLAYAQTQLPNVFKAMRGAFELPENSVNRARLVQAALATRLDSLENFLAYAQTQLPNVFKAIYDAVELPQNSANRLTLVQTALATPLATLAKFLKYAQTQLPSTFKAMRGAFELPENSVNRARLVQAALATRLDSLENFLAYAQTQLPTIWQEIASELESPSNVSVISQTALKVESGNFTGFLAYAASALPNLAKSVNATLAAAFREQGIRHPRLKPVLLDPRRLVEVDAVLDGCGCRDLLEEIAGLLIREADSAKWLRYGLVPVSAVLRLGGGADATDVQRFLEKIVTPDWLVANYGKLPPEVIATALFVLWAWTPDFVRRHFHAKALVQRAKWLVRNIHRCGTGERAIKPFELLGACQLLGLGATRTTRVWPPQTQLDEILRLSEANFGSEYLNSHQSLFFVGLREMARCRPDPVSIPRDIGGRVLALWQIANSPNANHQALNAWMIEWLGQCAKTNWRLVKDSVPLPRPVFVARF